MRTGKYALQYAGYITSAKLRNRTTNPHSRKAALNWSSRSDSSSVLGSSVAFRASLNSHLWLAMFRSSSWVKTEVLWLVTLIPPPPSLGEQLLQKATQLALDSLPRMKDNTVATLVWVMGQFQYYPGQQLLNHVAENVVSSVRGYSLPAVVKLVCGYATLRHYPGERPLVQLATHLTERAKVREEDANSVWQSEVQVVLLCSVVGCIPPSSICVFSS